MSAVLEEVPAVPIKLDLGCGKRKKEGFLGVDILKFEGVDVEFDFSAYTPWPWEDNSVEEVHCSHFLEHLEKHQRVRFMNELYRVLKVGGKATIITPHFSSNRAYGDMTHCWPPVSEMFFYYLDKGWRATEAPHLDVEFNPQGGFSCDFHAQWGYGIHRDVLSKNAEYQQFALQFFKEAAQDLHATLTKR